MRKKILASLIISIATTIVISGSVYATALIDSSTGGDYYFQWDGTLPVQIESIYETTSPGSDISIIWTDLGDDWSITVAEDSYLDMATAWDDYVPGDKFELVVDGTATSWTSTSIDSLGYFHGTYDDLFLSTGTHTLTLNVTSGLTAGGAWASFSATSPASAPVPEPATMLLFGTGLAGLAGLRKRNKK